MKVIADLCVVPIGVGTSVSKDVAAYERVLAEAGLKTKLHAYGTNIEGEWDEVFAAIKRCHEVVHAMGAPRISSTLRFGARTDREQHMAVCLPESGSGANPSGSRDDGQMPGFRPVDGLFKGRYSDREIVVRCTALARAAVPVYRRNGTDPILYRGRGCVYRRSAAAARRPLRPWARKRSSSAR